MSEISCGDLKSQKYGYYEARNDLWDNRLLNNNANLFHPKTSRCAAVETLGWTVPSPPSSKSQLWGVSTVTLFILFQTLKSIPWTADYTPPAPPDESTVTQKTPEEIEREIKVSLTVFLFLPFFFFQSLGSSHFAYSTSRCKRWNYKNLFWYTLSCPARLCGSSLRLLSNGKPKRVTGQPKGFLTSSLTRESRLFPSGQSISEYLPCQPSDSQIYLFKVGNWGIDSLHNSL